jgi:hypothetical protein
MPSIIACSLVAGETACPQSCSIAMAAVLPALYTAVSWQLVCISQYGTYEMIFTHIVHTGTPKIKKEKE